MKKNREKEILHSYLNECNIVQVYSNDNLSDKVDSIISGIVQYERPDMYSILEDEIYIIEHFEFDSYKSSKKKGSDYRQKEGKIKNEFDRLLIQGRDKEVSYNETIRSTASVNNYINNFIDKFNHHYEKIGEYKKRIAKIHAGLPKICFFVEDVSPLGSYYINNKRCPKNLFIFQFKRVIEFLLKHKAIYAIIYGFFDGIGGDKRKIIIIENNKKAIDKFIDDHEYVEELEYYWHEPNVSAVSIPILNIKG